MKLSKLFKIKTLKKILYLTSFNHKSTILSSFFPDSWILGSSAKILVTCSIVQDSWLKKRSWMSDKVRVDRIVAGEARKVFSDKILVFLTSCLILAFLLFLEWFFSSWISDKVLFLVVQARFFSSIYVHDRKYMMRRFRCVRLILFGTLIERTKNQITKKNYWIFFKVLIRCENDEKTSRISVEQKKRKIAFCFNKYLTYLILRCKSS